MEYPINYDSPVELKNFLLNANLSMKKRYGQNFLINKGARQKIISYLPINDKDLVWEIGPGLGAMTWHLLEKKANVNVFEIDFGFIKALKDFYGKIELFKIIEGDFLKNFKDLQKHKIANELPKYILGNLPYVTGSVMIAEIIKSRINPDKMVFTVQKEVGKRMAALPGTKDYSAFSLICQSKYNVVLKGELNPGSFYPQPSIKSIIVELTANHTFKKYLSDVYYELVDDLFKFRRKTIFNNLVVGKIAHKFGEKKVLAALSESNIDSKRRSETLSVKEVEIISKNILKYIDESPEKRIDLN